jgi:hypothetical protein
VEPSSTTTAERVYALFAASQRVGIHRYDQGGGADITQHLTPVIATLLDRTCAVLHDTFERCDPRPGATTLAPAKPPSSRAGELAFVAQAELRQQQQRLARHRADREVAELVRDCGGALRAIQKALYAVEPMLCALERIPRFLPDPLNVSLQVRRYYREFWRFAMVRGEQPSANVRSALRGAGTSIAVLIGSEIYSLLRDDDRLAIAELQTHILDCLRRDAGNVAASEPTPLELEVWREFLRFADRLRQVNSREELVEHDRALLDHALIELDQRGDEGLVEVHVMLNNLLGLDDGLDEVIFSNPSAKSLARELRRAANQLGARGSRGSAAPVAV